MIHNNTSTTDFMTHREKGTPYWDFICNRGLWRSIFQNEYQINLCPL